MRRSSFLFSAFLFISAIPASAFAADASMPADQVVVSRGGVDLTLGDIDAYMQTVPDKDRTTLMSDAHRAETVVLNLLRTKQLANQAREMKLDQRADVRYLIQTAENDILAKARMDAFVASLKMPDFNQLAKEVYATHPKDYLVPARVDVQHILISTAKHPDAEALATAEDVRKQALANPDSFTDLVEKYSDDGSKTKNEGKIENATNGKLVPEFEKAARELKKVGEISPVTKTSYGYHVLKLIALTPSKQQTFAEVQPTIVETLKSQYIDKQRVQLLDDFAREKNSTNTDVFASLATRYDKPGTPATPPQMPTMPSNESKH
jgi:parvulin-like peptidyl-prolyl isomerase